MSSGPRAARDKPDAPLAAADLEGLIPTFVATRADLNIAEQANIETATRWAFGRRLVTTPHELFTIEFSDIVHRRMFGEVYTWAGRHDVQHLPPGVQPHWIERRLRDALNDARRAHDLGITAPSELAVRLQRRLVKVHAYRDGNARHGRFMADLYLHLIGVPRLKWEAAHEPEAIDTQRRSDLTALQTALDKATRDVALRRSGAPVRPTKTRI